MPQPRRPERTRSPIQQINLEDQTYGTVHRFTNMGTRDGKKTHVDDTSAWHVYAVEWNAECFRFFVDDREFFAKDITDRDEYHMFHQP